MASVPTDKLLHFFYGSIIATPLAIGKEIIDAKKRFSPPNVMDAVFTFLPTLLLLAAKLL